jgi:SAM-dependent methyltransferase
MTDTMETMRKIQCRLCGSVALKDVLSLGDVYVSTFLKDGEQGIKCPLNLVQCPNCELVQLEHSAPQELLYARHYWYKSALNSVIVEDLKELAKIAESFMDYGDIVLDIGANDGTLLSFIDTKNYATIGCEPADNLQEDLKKNAQRVIHEFWNADYYLYPPAKVVLAIGMFYDMEDPNQFVRDAGKVLKEDGVFIAQLMTLKPMVEQNDVANICHEHLEYYSYPTLKRLYETNGLEIFKVEENSINGGSYRLYARKLKNGSIDYPENIDLLKFKENIERNKELAVSFIGKCNERGEKVYGYGASTKGNTILQYYGLTDKDIVGVVDPNPEKAGKKCVGSNIPVVPDVGDADYLFILPWGFTDSFIEKERARGYKGKFIVSIPETKIGE